jgi:hypothetical protein
MINETQTINAEEPSANKQSYYQQNKERLGARRRANYAANKEQINTKRKAYMEANKEQIAAKRNAYIKAYYEVNKEQLRAQRNAYIKSRLKTDTLFKFIYILRINSIRVFKRIGINKPINTQAMLGCSWQEAREHMEKLFQPGMTWANHGEWHIDHKVPIASATTIEEAIALNHIKNLQPLWAEDNLSKGARY